MPTDPRQDPDHGLPPPAYSDPEQFRRVTTRVLACTWHALPWPDPATLELGHARPWTLLPGALDEPLLLTRDDRGLHLLSNVCTHRAAALVDRVGAREDLRCGHHGRTFGLDGRLRTAPGFDGREGFPRACDHLASIPHASWGPLMLASLDPAVPADTWRKPLHSWLGFALETPLVPAPALGHDYHLPYSWLLACENGLEIAHAPHVHPSLDPRLGHDRGRFVSFDGGVVRVVECTGAEPSLTLPAGHPEHGRRIASLHAWLFPTTFVSAFPWGLRARLVLPEGPGRSRLVVMGWTCRPEGIEPELAKAFDQMEHEDQRVLATVARGLRSRHAPKAPLAPRSEDGIHGFHRRLASMLSGVP